MDEHHITIYIRLSILITKKLTQIKYDNSHSYTELKIRYNLL